MPGKRNGDALDAILAEREESGFGRCLGVKSWREWCLEGEVVEHKAEKIEKNPKTIFVAESWPSLPPLTHSLSLQPPRKVQHSIPESQNTISSANDMRNG